MRLEFMFIILDVSSLVVLGNFFDLSASVHCLINFWAPSCSLNNLEKFLNEGPETINVGLCFTPFSMLLEAILISG